MSSRLEDALENLGNNLEFSDDDIGELIYVGPNFNYSEYYSKILEKNIGCYLIRGKIHGEDVIFEMPMRNISRLNHYLNSPEWHFSASKLN